MNCLYTTLCWPWLHIQGSTKIFLEHLKFENIRNFKEKQKEKENKQKVIPTFLVSLALKKLHKVSFNDHSFEHNHPALKSHTLIITPKLPAQDFGIKHFKEVYKKDYKTNLMILPLYQMIHIHLSWACAFHSFLVWHLKMKSEIPDLFQGIQQLITFQNKH